MSTNWQERSSSWTGWVIFAGALMFTIGCLNVIQGLAALLKSDVYLVTDSGRLVTTNFSYRGWVLLVQCGLTIIVALGLFSGNEAARWFAIAAAVVNMIGLNAAVLSALTAAWQDAKPEPTSWARPRSATGDRVHAEGPHPGRGG